MAVSQVVSYDTVLRILHHLVLMSFVQAVEYDDFERCLIFTNSTLDLEDRYEIASFWLDTTLHFLLTLLSKYLILI